jgi:radical SAM protein with 4Fe4S-binding SPASM domain
MILDDSRHTSRAGHAEPPFDNVAVRLRGKGCAVCSICPPFVTVHWPDVSAAASDLGLSQGAAEPFTEGEGRRRFLAALADGPLKEERFRPARVGFPAGPSEVRGIERARLGYRRALFLGQCSRDALFGSLEAMSGRLPGGGTLDLVFRRWDPLADWPGSEECLREIHSYVLQSRSLRANLLLLSRVQEFDPHVWEFVYDHPRVRIGWVADGLLSGWEQGGLADRVLGSAPLSRLGELAAMGLWPHLVLPVCGSNVGCLPELVRGLLELVRGGTIDLVPTPYFSANRELEPPTVSDYVGALLALYRDQAAAMRLVSPLSWVAQRMDSQAALARSAASVGAEIAVLRSGDMYAGEFGVGIERWRIGNVLEDGDGLHWERLDAVPETFSNAMQPERCQTCDWRYRCGGLDASVFQLEERRRLAAQRGSPGTAAEALERIQAWPEGGMAGNGGDWSDLAELYCAPRKALFEEMLWDCAEGAAERQTAGPRERLELNDQGIAYVPTGGGA